jgi:hypothetical protein
MIMSHYTDLEMSLSQCAIMLPSKGGYYGREGHYHNEDEGAKKSTGNLQCNK